MPNPAFHSIALVGRHADTRVADSLRALAEHLTASGRTVIIDAAVDLQFAVPVQRGNMRPDLMVAVGGDGTMLHAARIASVARVPLVGVNRGRLGFLAEISPSEMLDGLDQVLAGRYERESRRMLAVQIVRDGIPLHDAQALNDVVLQKWETGRMLDFETWIDGRYVNTHGGDGLIVATSTGSTAYALSCGGPIVHPDLDALVVAPVCPHTLSDRPIVVRGSSQIELRLVNRPNSKAQITCDGTLLGDLELSDRLLIGPSQHQLELLHPMGYDYYRILRSKLHWGRGAHEHGDSGLGTRDS
jgi:NAD+ kinase